MTPRQVVERGPGLPPVHLSDAVIVGDLVFLSGRVARDPVTAAVTGRTIEDQTEAILRSFERALAVAGSSLGQVAKVTTFLVRREDFAGYDRVWRQHFEKEPPARTTVLARLRPEGALIEMEAISCR